MLQSESPVYVTKRKSCTYYQRTIRPYDPNRQAMVRKVHTIWIDGLLTESLAKVVRIDLGLEERPDAVTLPLNMQYQELTRPPQVISPNTPILQLFEQAAGELLILGNP